MPTIPHHMACLDNDLKIEITSARLASLQMLHKSYIKFCGIVHLSFNVCVYSLKIGPNQLD